MKKTLLLLSLLLFTAVSFAQTANLTPVSDNSIYSDNTANSNGLGKLYCGNTCGSGIRRSLLMFDLSSIPAGATITSVTLDVTVDNVSAGASSNTYNIHPLTLSFGEGTSSGGGTGATAVAPDATWNDAMLGTSAWTLVGGDFTASISSVAMDANIGMKTFPTSTSLVSTVQAWLATPATNFGIVIIGDESTTCTARRFGSKEQGTAPVLNVTYTAPPCTTPPTAVCQNTILYLDGTGNATLTPSDLDGGSLDNCGTPGLTFSASQTAFTCADIASGGTPSDALIVTGVMDGPLPGGLPKVIEMYAASNISDLSIYGVGSANNGGGTDGEEFTFPADALTAGQFIYVATDSVNFNSWFGIDPNYTSGMAAINGDDAIELFYNGNVVDIFGDINTDGTGQPWEYLDGWAYRNNSTGPDGSVFAIGNWSFSGINVLDGELTNATAATPFPIASYTPAGVGTSVTLTVTDGDLNTADCIASVNVLDTISPTATAPATINVECFGDIPAADSLLITDEADNCGNASVIWSGDVSDGQSCPETITRTYTVNDDHGNSIDLIQLIVVSDVTPPTASNPVTINVECIGDVPAVDILEVTDALDNCTIAPVVTHVSDVSDGLTCPETITRTYAVTDNCGLQVTVDQLIIVNDVTGPVADATLSTINGSCDITPATPTATDNCDGSLNGVSDVAFPISTAGTTTVTWTYTDVCGNTSTQTQDVIIAAQDVSTTLNGLTISAVNSTATYQWIDCATNQPINGETSQNYTATANGNYAVILTENGCSDTSACTLIDNVGLNDLQIESMSLYPNPTKDGIFSINYDGLIQNITVIDMTGRKVEALINLNEKSVDGSQLESGKYMVQITVEDDQVIQGVILIQK